MLQHAFENRDVNLEILIPFELGLNFHDVLSVPDLSVMNCLELFLKLVKLGPKLFALILDFFQSLLRLLNCLKPILPLGIFHFLFRQLPFRHALRLFGVH